jgi:hypothetical protein
LTVVVPYKRSHTIDAREIRHVIKSLALLVLVLAAVLGADTMTPPQYRQICALVTGYKTVPAQTDRTPCIAASGANICGRSDVVACPRNIRFGTLVEIRGVIYVCEDRTAQKFDGRFDISCDKDAHCPYTLAGWTTVKIFH